MPSMSGDPGAAPIRCIAFLGGVAGQDQARRHGAAFADTMIEGRDHVAQPGPQRPALGQLGKVGGTA